MGDRENANMEKKNQQHISCSVCRWEGKIEKEWSEETEDIGIVRKVKRWISGTVARGAGEPCPRKKFVG